MIVGFLFMKNMEIWKDVPDYNGMYQVSNFGNVKSLKFGRERILKYNIEAYGYHYVVLCKNNKTKNFKIHHLIAITFLNHILNGKNNIVVDHINNIRSDNRLDNLQIITQRENVSKDIKNKTSKYTGVCWNKRNSKWISTITINDKLKYLGTFIDEYDAHLAYQKELKIIS